MSINKQAAVEAAKQALVGDIDFSKAPTSEKLIKAIVEAVLTEVTKATVTVPAAGLTSPQGPVTGSATGTIS